MSVELKPIRVLCVDDTVKIAEAYRRLIDQQPDMQCVGVLHSADQLADKAAENCPTVTLLDLTMPGKDPLAAVKELAARCPDTRVLVFSGHSDQATKDEAFQAGAWGLVGKTEDPQAVIRAIRAVAKGETVFDSASG